MEITDRLEMAANIFRQRMDKPYYSESYKEACKIAVEVLEKEMERYGEQGNVE